MSHARMRRLGTRQRQLPHTPQVSVPARARVGPRVGPHWEREAGRPGAHHGAPRLHKKRGTRVRLASAPPCCPSCVSGRRCPCPSGRRSGARRWVYTPASVQFLVRAEGHRQDPLSSKGRDLALGLMSSAWASRIRKLPEKPVDPINGHSFN